METPPKNVAQNQDEIVTEIYIAAPPERVFQSLVEPGQVEQWWGQTGVYRCTGFETDLRPGGRWRSVGVGPDGGTFEIVGEYLEVQPSRLLVTTWVATWTGDAKTTVRWELQPVNGGTLVRIRHSGFASHPELAQNYRGWPRMLGWLRAFVEKGETVDMRPPATWNTKA
jgi:uncharacterized protein YndB with AHSA1/START domain